VVHTPILVLASDIAVGEQTVGDLRRLGRVSVMVDAATAAIEMMQAIDFAFVMVHVSTADDWSACRAVTAAAGCPVAVVTYLIARDRRYRRRAFAMGVSAYLHRPYKRRDLRYLLRCLEQGGTEIEVVRGVPW
jgi:DNA-binding NarL/FixJ family response regulator